MKYLRKYNESQWVPAGIKDLSLDIEDILLEFADSGLLTEVNIINNDICNLSRICGVKITFKV